MNSGVVFRAVRVASVGAFASLVVACGGARFVPISYEAFQPNLTSYAEKYKDKSVLLYDFANHAENTKYSRYLGKNRRNYGSPNSGPAGIGGRPLDSYFWYCFEKGLTNAGFAVLKDGDPHSHEAPSLRVVLDSIYEDRFVFTVEAVRRGTPIVTRQIDIREPTPASGEDTAHQLEARAYRMMNRSIQAVLSDPEIQKLLAGP